MKAFDLLDWEFLKAILIKVGFGKNFLKFFSASTVHASSAIIINGRQSQPFSLARSVRQGSTLTLAILDSCQRLEQHDF